MNDFHNKEFEKNVSNCYNTLLYNDLKRIRKLRYKYLFSFIFLVLFSALGLYVEWLIFNSDNSFSANEIVIFNISIFVYIFIFLLPKEKFLSISKQYIQDIILSIFNNFSEDKNFDFSKELKERCLLYLGKTKVFNGISGYYNNVNINIFELSGHRCSTSDGEGNFRGILLFLTFNNKVLFPDFLYYRKSRDSIVLGIWFTKFVIMLLLIFSKTTLFVKFLCVICLVCSLFILKYFKNKYKNIQDINLNNNLIDEIHILTNTFGGKLDVLSFYDNKVVLAISTNTPIFEPVSNFLNSLIYKKIENNILKFYRIMSVVDIINEKYKGDKQ